MKRRNTPAVRSCVAEQVTIRPATTAADLAAVRSLCWDYRDYLLSMQGVSEEVTDAFRPASKYEALMENLPILHARPKGIIMLATDPTGTPVACGMSHPLDGQTSEIKRVFVADAARGQNVAHQLCTSLNAQAHKDGFSRVVLDTHRLLHAAQRLYEKLGFSRRGPYQPMPDNVLPELVFFEKHLAPAMAPK